MASMWRKAMLYLGLGPDEDYDDYEILGSNGPTAPPREPMRRPIPERRPVSNHAATPREPEPTGAVRPINTSPSDGSVRQAPHHSSSAPTNGHAPRTIADRSVASRPRPSVIRPVAVASAKPHVVAPASFSDAQEVADEFKRTVPVIVNLQGVERELMRRIIDFASGLCYGLGGQMERVANHVYLLTPSDVEVSPEERRRWRERGDEG
jgi:cell division inhibitor SepF